jgi:hypothetical protein
LDIQADAKRAEDEASHEHGFQDNGGFAADVGLGQSAADAEVKFESPNSSFSELPA